MEGISRRRLLGWLGAAGVGAAAGAGGVGLAGRGAAAVGAGDEVVPFHGSHQAGIATPQQTHLVFAALDVADASRQELRGLLKYWTEAAFRMSQGRVATANRASRTEPAWDTGEASGLSPSRLTVTFGVGASLFTKDGVDRFGLAAAR